MKCKLCDEEAVCTITVKIASKPYVEDRPFCEKHGGYLEKILGVKRNE